jgi:hypothetical protein
MDSVFASMSELAKKIAELQEACHKSFAILTVCDSFSCICYGNGFMRHIDIGAGGFFLHALMEL